MLVLVHVHAQYHLLTDRVKDNETGSAFEHHIKQFFCGTNDIKKKPLLDEALVAFGVNLPSLLDEYNVETADDLDWEQIDEDAGTSISLGCR